MAKITKSFSLDESVFEDLERLAAEDYRKTSDYLNLQLRYLFAKMQPKEGRSK